MRYRTLQYQALLIGLLFAGMHAAADGFPIPAHAWVTLPPVMRFCSPFCVVLTLNGDHYEGSLETDPKHTPLSKVTVKSFSPDQVILDSLAVNGEHTLLVGTISDAGNSLVGGKIRFLNGLRAGSVYPFELSWGDALATAKRQGTVHPLDWTQDDRIATDQETFNWACSDAVSNEYRRQMNQPLKDKRVYAMAALSAPDGRLNLNGLWSANPAACVSLKGKPLLILYRIHQDGNHIRIVAETPQWQHDGDTLFEGTLTDSGQIIGKSVLNAHAFSPQWMLTDDSVTIKDADELLFKSFSAQLLRISPPGLADAPCDASGTPRVSAEMAGQRGVEAITLLHDYKKALCWLTTGLALNDPMSAGLLAGMYYTGTGVPQDYKQASQLAVKGGVRGNDMALASLSVAAATGHGDAQNMAAARFFFEQARSKPDAIHDLSWGPTTLQEAERNPAVNEADYIPVILRGNAASEAAGSEPDCRTKGALALDAGTQWKNSQIAFGEKDFPMAACWALMSAVQGNVDAQLATAWFFSDGLGVDQSDKAAILWYQFAAQKGDLLAEAYMSNAALYQMLDLNLSRQYAEEAKKQPGGDALLLATQVDIRARAKESLDNLDLNRVVGVWAAQALSNFSTDSDAYDDAYHAAQGNHWSEEAAKRAGDEAWNESQRNREAAEQAAQPTEADELNAEFINIKSHLN
jgi:TPR repeat protein